MEEGRAPYEMKAPGAGSSSRSYKLPGGDDLPRVDDYRTDIDFESQEMIGGVVYDVMSADFPHAQCNGHLDYLLRGVAAPGYSIASDLKTRVSHDDDFASDSALVKDGIDSDSGARHLEEIAFEVIDKQSPQVVTRKAPRMIRRGVRRVFAVFVKTGRVKEWSVEANDWVTLHTSAVIEDPVLVEPVTVTAVLDAAEADDTVVRALAKKDNPEILRIRQQERLEGQEEGKAEGRIEAQRQAVLSVLAARDLDVPETVRDAVLSCSDPAVLDRWVQAAATAAAAADVLHT